MGGGEGWGLLEVIQIYENGISPCKGFRNPFQDPKSTTSIFLERKKEIKKVRKKMARFIKERTLRFTIV